MNNLTPNIDKMVEYLESNLLKIDNKIFDALCNFYDFYNQSNCKPASIKDLEILINQNVISLHSEINNELEFGDSFTLSFTDQRLPAKFDKSFFNVFAFYAEYEKYLTKPKLSMKKGIKIVSIYKPKSK